VVAAELQTFIFPLTAQLLQMEAALGFWFLETTLRATVLGLMLLGMAALGVDHPSQLA
jgi:hypothetical protein